MGFPVGYTEVFIPTLFIHTLTFFTLLRKILFNLFNYMGLSDFLEPGPIALDQLPPPLNATTIPRITVGPTSPPLSAIVTRELLPLVRVSKEQQEKESCAVCLYEFSSGEEIRWLSNCKHIFHKDCLDRWMDLDHRTCPLCRTPFLLHDLLDEFNQRLLAADSCDLLQYVDHYNYTGFSL
ncbi:E3 ubiquitin-protein ligase RHA1B-like [Chenopodium quinoa]|uniref:RING-type domain-containing protein n=1 Tax=Chenopodium quinoa TaxID=63459 RepID=A0A803KZD0_CHEQI|nr:E3 ubiquitin-protein ligase RHA1B-like [Chenopodium quinoa]